MPPTRLAPSRRPKAREATAGAKTDLKRLLPPPKRQASDCTSLHVRIQQRHAMAQSASRKALR
jgi:hypothetical protein